MEFFNIEHPIYKPRSGGPSQCNVMEEKLKIQQLSKMNKICVER